MSVINLDCLAGMRLLIANNSIDAIITDPPYELGFMGKEWDSTGIAYSVELWRECLRVLKPGGHLLAFGGARTYHRMACAIEDAGLEIRDQIMWIYGSGFPKSLNIEDGRGTALKPAHEPLCLARKPLEGTVVNNVTKYNTGVINIDACRIGSEVTGWNGLTANGNTWDKNNCGLRNAAEARPVVGRFPANLMHDGSEEVLNEFAKYGISKFAGTVKPMEYKNTNVAYGKFKRNPGFTRIGDEGTPARFYYCAKATRHDRDEGLDQFVSATAGEITGGRAEHSAGLNSPRAGAGRTNGGKNIHPTVKPTELMRYLIKLITPKNGIILDPFAGSGSTGKAAALEGFSFVGFELNNVYADIANARIAAAKYNY
jgi:DNA modification methylase